MKDGIIGSNKNSRLLKAVLPSTYEALVALASSSGVPLDLLMNEAGWQQLPTYLNKGNLLSDGTETAIWGNAADRTVDAALNKLASKVAGMIGAGDLCWVKVAETAITAEVSQLSLSVAHAEAYQSFRLIGDYVNAATGMALSWGGESTSIYTVSKLETGSHCSLKVEIIPMPNGGVYGMADMYSSLLSDTGFYLPNAPTSGTVTVSIQPTGGSKVFTSTSKLILYGMKKILA